MVVRSKKKPGPKSKKSKLDSDFKILSSGSPVLLVLTSGDNQDKSLERVLKTLESLKAHGVFITTTKSSSKLTKEFKKRGLDTSRLIFIDFVKKPEGHKDMNRRIYVNSLSNLTELSIAISQALDTLKEKPKFLILHSIPTLHLYNKPEVLARFLNFIISKLREWNVKGVFFSLATPQEGEFTERTKEFYDKIIKVKKHRKGEG